MVLIVALAVANRQTVAISFDPFNAVDPAYGAQLPLYLLVLLLVIAGVLIGGIAAWLKQSRWRRRARRVESQLRRTEAEIDRLNADPSCHGYIVQLPLPRHLDTDRILERIDPAKDADGLHPINLGRLVLNEPATLPCTPRGIVELLRRHGVELNGAEVVVVGRGITVRRPLGLICLTRCRAGR